MNQLGTVIQTHRKRGNNWSALFETLATQHPDNCIRILFNRSTLRSLHDFNFLRIWIVIDLPFFWLAV